MFTTTQVTADLAADRRRSLMAEAEAHRLARAAQSNRDTARPRWAWARRRGSTAMAVADGRT